jgi:hypothetical protein
VPGCRRRCWLDAHHLVWYSRGGKHQIKNLIFLCRWHHAQHHDGKLLIEVSARGELRFRAKVGWVLGEGGELRPDREWLEQRLAKDGKPDEEVLEIMAALEGDVEQAYQETPAEDRGWVFARATGWEVREWGVVYLRGTIPRDRRHERGKTIPRDRGARWAGRPEAIPRDRWRERGKTIPRDRLGTRPCVPREVAAATALRTARCRAGR